MPAETPSRPPERLAVPAEHAAEMLGITESHWWKLVSSGRAPEPVRLGRRCVWPLQGPAGLRAWVQAGCPPRSEWRARQTMKARTAELDALAKKPSDEQAA